MLSFFLTSQPILLCYLFCPFLMIHDGKIFLRVLKKRIHETLVLALFKDIKELCLGIKESCFLQGYVIDIIIHYLCLPVIYYLSHGSHILLFVYLNKALMKQVDESPYLLVVNGCLFLRHFYEKNIIKIKEEKRRDQIQEFLKFEAGLAKKSRRLFWDSKGRLEIFQVFLRSIFFFQVHFFQLPVYNFRRTIKKIYFLKFFFECFLQISLLSLKYNFNNVVARSLSDSRC